MKLSDTIINPHVKFINKDVIYTPEKTHPPEFRKYKQTGNAAIDIAKFLELQQKHRIGKIISVSEGLAQFTNERIYTALIEIDTQKGINLYRHGLLPKYVSPSIYITRGNGWNDIQDFEALHLALVNSPSYNYRKARVTASCQNTPEICIQRLAQAHQQLIQANWATPKKRKRTQLEVLKAVIEHTTGRRI